jgi:hypothetical protein
MRTNTSTTVVEISTPSKRSTAGDQRSTPRLPLTYAVLLSRPGEAFGVVTKTENVNCKGFYCISERRFLPRERLECEMVIASGSSHFEGDDLVLHALVEVLRVTPRVMGRGFGVACRLESYTIGPRADLSPAG